MLHTSLCRSSEYLTNTVPEGFRGLPCLEEPHRNFWNRQDLEPELFLTVKVTRAHCDALQARLDQKYPGRDLVQYDGVVSRRSSNRPAVHTIPAVSPRVLLLSGRSSGGITYTALIQ